MIPPKHRPIAGAFFGLIALAPILTMGTVKGQSQGIKNEAETARQSRLEAVAKASISDNCYIAPIGIAVGAEFPVVGKSQSVCITLKDNSRYGFIEYQKGVLTIVDAFSQKEVKAKISTLGVKSK
jgi:hypothetical protein